MTAHPLDLVRSLRNETKSTTSNLRLHTLDQDQLGQRTVVFMPTGHLIDQLMQKAGKRLSGLADVQAVRKVLSHNPDTLWAVARRNTYNAAAPSAEGFVALLLLNGEGIKALADGSLNRSDPDLCHLSKQNERPAGIYIWAAVIPPVLIGAIAQIYEKFRAPLYDGVPIYAFAVSAAGKQIAERLGFQKGAPLEGDLASQIYYYPRNDLDTAALPSYDRYHPTQNTSQLSVKVAHSFEDLARIISIRSAVYISEQDCPYDEEFDGNDISSTHLIGYVGNEPAGCLRLRYFGSFAKVERLAVRHEFRHTRLAFLIVRAGIDLCRKKGFRMLYGHSRKDLVRFWRMFGFRPIEGRPEFNFSDVAYIEISLSVTPDPDAVAIGADPYLIIRPEGQWHKPGILEQSAMRGVHPVVGETQQ